jgi:CDGSH-type Zn-finger protein
MSRNQPFCDNSHRRRGWESGPTNDPATEPPPPRAGAAAEPTQVIAKSDASLDLRGHLRIYHSDGKPIAEAGRVLLCRCGKSRNKPFCDSSHEQAGFRSTAPDVPRDRLEADTPAAFTPNPQVPEPPA